MSDDLQAEIDREADRIRAWRTTRKVTLTLAEIDDLAADLVRHRAVVIQVDTLRLVEAARALLDDAVELRIRSFGDSLRCKEIGTWVCPCCGITTDYDDEADGQGKIFLEHDPDCSMVKAKAALAPFATPPATVNDFIGQGLKNMQAKP